MTAYTDRISDVIDASGSSTADDIERALAHYDLNDIIAVLAKRAASNGGSSPFTGARITLSSPVATWDGSKIPFDTAVVDSDGYFSAADNQFYIPTGKAGPYLVSFGINVADDTGITAVLGFIEADDTFEDVNPRVVCENISGTWYGVVTVGPMICNEGDGIYFDGNITGAATASLALAYASLMYLGPTT